MNKSENIKCDICPEEAVMFKGDCHGKRHGACEEHRKFLPGWIQDIKAESDSDSEAARRYELSAYGEKD